MAVDATYAAVVGSDPVYGFAAGRPDGLHIICEASVYGFRIRQGTNTVFRADLSGNLSLEGNLTLGEDSVLSAVASAFDTGVGYWLDYNAGTPRFRVGDPAGNRVSWDGTDLTLVSATVTIDDTGISVTPGGGSGYVASSSYRFDSEVGLFADFIAAGPVRSLGVRNEETGGSGTRNIHLRATSEGHLAWLTLSAAASGATIDCLADRVSVSGVLAVAGVIEADASTPIRIPNATHYYARNAADSGDEALIGIDGSNRRHLSLGGNALVVNSAATSGSAGSVTGYIHVFINGTERRIPYHTVS